MMPDPHLICGHDPRCLSQDEHDTLTRQAQISAFVARFPDAAPEWPAGSTDPTHTHGGNRFWMFEGSALEFCSACALGLPPDHRPINDGAMDPRD